MIRYTLKRFLSLCISLAVASLLIFFVIEIAPGDPASFMLGINAQPDTVAALRAELGLDVPKFERYLAWAQGMLTGDFGMSYTYRTPVSQMVADRLWVSLPLALFALALSTIIALPAGIYAAARRGQDGRRCRDERHPAWRRDPQLLVRHDVGSDLCDQTALVRRRWLCRLGQRAGRSHVVAHLARYFTRPAPSRNSGPRHAIRLARCDERGLHAHRPRQGFNHYANPVETWAAQRADPCADHHRLTVFIPPCWWDHH